MLIPRKQCRPLTRRAVSGETNRPTSAAPNHCVLESTCSRRWPRDTGETAHSGVYNLFDKAGKHAIPFVNTSSSSRLRLEKKAGQGVSMGSEAGTRTGLFRHLGTRNFPVTGVSHIGTEIQSAYPVVCQL